MDRAYQRILIKRNKKKEHFFIVVGLLLAIVVLVYSLWLLRGIFRIQDIYIYGNHQIRNEEIRGLIKIKKGDRLFDTNLIDIYERLKAYPWVKDAKIRKELTGVVRIFVKEATPVALIQIKGRTYLVDGDGVLLEDIGETKTFFLPVIKGIDPVKERTTYKEALSFIRFISDKRLFLNTTGIEISGSRPEDIYVVIDGVQIIVGAGDYEVKMERLDFVRKEIIRRNISVNAIDLRFANKIIVKPETGSHGNGDVEKKALQ